MDLMPQLGQYGGLIAGPRADFEGTRMLRQPQQVGHQGNDVRLGDGLTVADRQWPVGIGQLALGDGYEGMTRYAAHRVDHAGIECCGHRTAAALSRAITSIVRTIVSRAS